MAVFRLLLAVACELPLALALPFTLSGAQVTQLTETLPRSSKSHHGHHPHGLHSRHWPHSHANKSTHHQLRLKRRSGTSACPTACSDSTFAPFKDWQGVGGEVMKTWGSNAPGASVLVEDPQSVCSATTVCAPGATLTIVTEMEKATCTSEEASTGGAVYKPVPWNAQAKVEVFTTPAVMPAGGTSRQYVRVSPKVTCSSKSKCPVVVSLHGHSEHESPELMQAWGYLNYLHNDASCASSLRSLMLFPQLIDGESWVVDGAKCIETFVLPMLDHIDSTENSVDLERVALVGYSEGAVGALQGAMLFPDVFTVVAAGSPVLPKANWDNVPVRPPRSGTPKLKLMAVAYGEDDIMGDLSPSLEHAVKMMTDHKVIQNTQFRVRMYPHTKHITAWEALFNNWEKLFQVLWKGDFASLSAW